MQENGNITYVKSRNWFGDIRINSANWKKRQQDSESKLKNAK